MALRCKQRAILERARASRHRAAVEELEARAASGNHEAAQCIGAEAALAQAAELRARALDERAAAEELRYRGRLHRSEAKARAAEVAAAAAESRARAYERRALSLAALDELETQAALA